MTELEASFHDAPIATSATDLRSAFTPLQEGVVSANDLLVSAGAVGLSVDVASGVVFMQGDSAVDQGLYRGRNDATKNSTAFVLGGIPAAHATQPRIDQIIARAYDTDVPGDTSGLRLWRLEVLPGTATAGATLANRTGAAGLPNGATRLADVLVPAAAGSIVAGNIRDRRPWARGLYWRSAQNFAGDYTITNTSPAALDTTNLRQRLEFTGRPCVVRIEGAGQLSATGINGLLVPRLDGATIGGVGTSDLQFAVGTANKDFPLNAAGIVFTPSAGSHLFDIYANVSAAGTFVLHRGFGNNLGLYVTIEEMLQDVAGNGAS